MQDSFTYIRQKIIENKGMVWENIMPIIVSELEVQDIDNETDWELAEIKYKIMCEKIKEFYRMIQFREKIQNGIYVIAEMSANHAGK